MKVRVVAETILANSAGQTVESVPVIIGAMAGVDSVVCVVDAVAGVPVRLVAEPDVLFNSAGQRVDPLWVIGI